MKILSQIFKKIRINPSHPLNQCSLSFLATTALRHEENQKI